MVSPANRIVSTIIVFLFLTFTSCHVARYVYWNYADVSDYKKFPADTLQASPSPHSFPVSILSEPPVLPEKTRNECKVENLDQFFTRTKTLAFLILRNDTLICEKYYKGYDRDHVIPSFSVSKSFVSALVGIAIRDGLIRNIHQAVTDYLPEMKDPGFHKVTLEDLLTMRSGIRFNEGYSNPFGDAAKFYYGLNLKKYTRNLKVVRKPGSIYEYASGNTQILGMVLEKATGKSLPEYMEEKLWKPMGATHEATWSLDSKQHHEAKAFCCINAVPEDFALFGELYLNKGVSSGQQVVPENWIEESLTVKNDSKDSQGYPYTYMWRVMDNGSFFAKGILGQFIFVCPSKHIVIIRMGETAGTINWPEFMQMLTGQL
jgi:CubicO group peptidase (beta-lactamase class C family)